MKKIGFLRWILYSVNSEVFGLKLAQPRKAKTHHLAY